MKLTEKIIITVTVTEESQWDNDSHKRKLQKQNEKLEQ